MTKSLLSDGNIELYGRNVRNNEKMVPSLLSLSSNFCACEELCHKTSRCAYHCFSRLIEARGPTG